MYHKIIDYLKEKPFAYEQGSDKFWDDEYISKSMLDAHLDPVNDGASRNHAFIRKSAEWIADIALPARGRELLDLGCGPGIYADMFDSLGFSVTGIDYSRRSVEYAVNSCKFKRKNIRYRCMDYRSLEYESQFDVITLIYCDFGVFNPSDRALLMKKIYRALKPGGVFIFDVFSKARFCGFEETQTVEYSSGGFWDGAPYVCIKRNIRYDVENAYLEQYFIITGNECRRYNIWNSAYDEETLAGELKDAGFSTVSYYGDVSGKTKEKNDDIICAVAGKLRNP